jgi:hypothetical protein
MSTNSVSSSTSSLSPSLSPSLSSSLLSCQNFIVQYNKDEDKYYLSMKSCDNEKISDDKTFQNQKELSEYITNNINNLTNEKNNKKTQNIFPYQEIQKYNECKKEYETLIEYQENGNKYITLSDVLFSRDNDTISDRLNL